MTSVVTIGTVTTPVISYREQRVCTTQQLAQFYGCTDRNLTDNSQRNADRFEEGKHFVKIAGEELRAFKSHYPADSGVVAKRAPHLILWTARGAARHAKMLETDVAWDVFEQLEDAYFVDAGRSTVGRTERSTKLDRLPLYHFAVDTVIRHRLLFSKVYLLLNQYAGSRSFGEMTKEQAAEVHDFCDRFALGQDTRNDWQRIADNHVRMHGEPAQLDMVQKLLLS